MAATGDSRPSTVPSASALARNGGLVDETERRIRALVAGPRSTAKDLIAASLATRTIS
jgi:hypothetical protein